MKPSGTSFSVFLSDGGAPKMLQGLEPQAVAVSPYGWLMTHYGWLAGLSRLAVVSTAAA